MTPPPHPKSLAIVLTALLLAGCRAPHEHARPRSGGERYSEGGCAGRTAQEATRPARRDPPFPTPAWLALTLALGVDLPEDRAALEALVVELEGAANADPRRLGAAYLRLGRLDDAAVTLGARLRVAPGDRLAGNLMAVHSLLRASEGPYLDAPLVAEAYAFLDPNPPPCHPTFADPPPWGPWEAWPGVPDCVNVNRLVLGVLRLQRDHADSASYAGARREGAVARASELREGIRELIRRGVEPEGLERCLLELGGWVAERGLDLAAEPPGPELVPEPAETGGGIFLHHQRRRASPAQSVAPALGR